MRRSTETLIALLAIIALSGCAINMGKTTTDKCTGVYVSLGNTTGPCGMEGGVISVPGAGLVVGVFSAVSDAVMGFFGSAPVVIQHHDSETEPEAVVPEQIQWNSQWTPGPQLLGIPDHETSEVKIYTDRNNIARFERDQPRDAWPEPQVTGD